MNNECKNYNKCAKIAAISCLCVIAGRESVGVPNCDNCNMAIDMEEGTKNNETD